MNKKYVNFKLCRACLNWNNVFLILKMGYIRIIKGIQTILWLGWEESNSLYGKKKCERGKIKMRLQRKLFSLKVRSEEFGEYKIWKVFVNLSDKGSSRKY